MQGCSDDGRSPRDIIAEAIASTKDGGVTLLVQHAPRGRRMIAQHALDALGEAGYTVVLTAEYEELLEIKAGAEGRFPRCLLARSRRRGLVLLDSCRPMVGFWATCNLPDSARTNPQGTPLASAEDETLYRLPGALHSWLCIIDGVNAGIHGFDLVATPHPDDKDYLRAEGEDWSEPGTVINGDVYLHDMLYEGTWGRT